MNLTRSALIRHCWQTGNLEYLVRDYQLPIYQALWKAIADPKTLKYLLNIARRFGKSHIVSIVLTEFAIRHANSQIRYACSTRVSLLEFFEPIMAEILSHCPEDLRPEKKGHKWYFKNGSTVTVAGVNGQHEDDLRGTSSHLNIVDEAGMIDRLKYLIGSVLMPQQLTVDGSMIIMGTPSAESEHEYTEVYRECKEEGNVLEYTVFDNKSLDEEKILAFMKEAGGAESATWKREYLVQFVHDENKQIIPEWDSEKYVKELPRDEFYNYYHKYTAMDTGFRDNNASIFGYYDFRRAAIVIENELVLAENEWDTEILSVRTKEVEKELWHGQAPLRRVADNNNLIILNDLNRLYQLPFIAVSKDELKAMVGDFRTWVKTGRVIVHPRCTYLIACLENGVWDKNHEKFAKSKIYKHYDALAAIIYLIRGIDVFTNPVPVTHKVDVYNDYIPLEVVASVTGESNTVKNMRKFMESRRTTVNKGIR